MAEAPNVVMVLLVGGYELMYGRIGTDKGTDLFIMVLLVGGMRVRAGCQILGLRLFD